MGFSSIFRGACVALITIMFALVLSTCGGERKAPSSGLSALNAESSGSPAELEDSPGKVILGRSDKPVSVPGASPMSGGVPLNVHFFDDGSYDPDGGEIVKWEWNFGDQEEGQGGWHDYTETRGDAWHIYDKPGTKVVHLRVTDNDGNTDVAFVKITLRKGGNANPTATANAEPLFGNAPLTVSFNAEGSYDPDGEIVKYEWDFDEGAGYQDFTDTNGSAEYTYEYARTYTAVLRVTDDDGAMSTDSVEIEVTLPSLNWQIHPVDTLGDVGSWTSITMLNQKPAIAYIGNLVDEGVTTDGDLKFARARTKTPSGPADWQVHTVDTSGEVESSVSCVLVNGKPIISYKHHATGSLRVARALTPAPCSSADWQVHTVDTGEVGWWSSLAVIDGKPAISYIDHMPLQGDADLRFAQAASSTPSSGADWLIHVVDNSLNVGHCTSMIVVNGKPAISYHDGYNLDLKFAQATTSTPGGSADWRIHAVDTVGDVGNWTAAAVIGGLPAIAYNDITNADLKYAHALVIEPTGSADWQIHTVDSAGDVGYPWHSLIAIEGQPAVSYFDNTNFDLKYAWAKAAHPAGAGDWLVYTVDTEGDVGRCSSLMELNSEPAISYWDYTNSDLKFARIDTGFVDVNDPPIADLTATPDQGEAPLLVSFDASGSTDTDGVIARYEFDFGEAGSWLDNGYSSLATHTYCNPGTYAAQVRVTDDSGATDTAQAGVEVTGAATTSPWPMFGQNLQHTSLSPYNGPATNALKWTFNTGTPILGYGPSVAPDGTVYAGSMSYFLHAINPDGSQKWSFPTGGWVLSAPAVGDDGTIYAGSNDNKLYAINPDGSQKWAFPTGGGVHASPMIGSDGTIYVTSFDHRLYAINPNGTLKWSYASGWLSTSSPAIALDGTVYFGSQDRWLYAVNPNGTLKWRFLAGDQLDSSPTIGADGTIYVGSKDHKVYAINPNGTLKWTYTTGDMIHSSAAIGPDGTVYIGSDDNNLYALNSNGSLLWSYATLDNITGSPSIGADGTIYIGSWDNYLYALNPNGTLKWSYATMDDIYTSVAIDASNCAYVSSRDGKVYAFGQVGEAM